MVEGRYDERRLGELLSLLAPPPDAWIRAARELPRARLEIDRIATLAEADTAYRRRVLADLESALRDGGVEPSARLVAELRGRLS